MRTVVSDDECAKTAKRFEVVFGWRMDRGAGSGVNSRGTSPPTVTEGEAMSPHFGPPF